MDEYGYLHKLVRPSYAAYTLWLTLCWFLFFSCITEPQYPEQDVESIENIGSLSPVMDVQSDMSHPQPDSIPAEDQGRTDNDANDHSSDDSLADQTALEEQEDTSMRGGANTESAPLPLEDQDIRAGQDSQEPIIEAGITTELDLASYLDPEEERCDLMDNDLDGQIDEGLNNPCGGCNTPARYPCSNWLASWIVSAPELVLDDRAIVSGGTLLGVNEIEVEGKTCQISRYHESTDARLDAFEVRGDSLQQTLLPPNDQRSAYLFSDPISIRDMIMNESLVELLWQDQGEVNQLIGRAPSFLDGGLSEALTAFASFAQHRSRSIPSLYWQPYNDPSSPDPLYPFRPERPRLFIGGSRALFSQRARSFSATRYFQLSGTLRDDGRFILPERFQNIGFLGASVRSYFQRSVHHRWVGSYDLLDWRLGTQVEARSTGDGSFELSPTSLHDIGFILTHPNPMEEHVDLNSGLRIQIQIAPTYVDATVLVRLSAREGSYVHLLNCPLTGSNERAITIPPQILTILRDSFTSPVQWALSMILIEQEEESHIADVLRYEQGTQIYLRFTELD